MPWRRTRDPYHILVSEVMLQQTQVSRVIPKYENWLTVFFTVDVLAKASVSEVLTHWMGLGYNRRALYLKKCAEEVVRRNGWPQTEEELMELPGIGTYTARALLCFAFGKEVAVVDTNVRKVILTQFQISNKNIRRSRDPATAGDARIDSGQARMTEKEIEEIAEKLLPQGNARDWNQALMDYASVVLKKEKIPIPKQSTYRGSDRYYRAKILKLLLTRKQVEMQMLGPLLRDDYSLEMATWLDNIIEKLIRDGLITQHKRTILILQT